jgi:glycosyltransferase involved in cell wall biosynthesis
VRIAVYTDYPYREVDGQVYAERAFALFLARLAQHFERFTVIGRLAPGTGRGRYALGEEVGLVPLPYYSRLSEPLPVLRALADSLRRFWRALDDADCVWLLGPHPLAFPFAALARLRGKKLVLGVRENLPEYVRSRHPGRLPLHVAADALDFAFRLLGRFHPVVAIGPGLAGRYRRSRLLLPLTVSLIDANEVVSPGSRQRDYGGELDVLSVGRLDTEKNPLLLAEVLALLDRGGKPWRLVVCGEGSLAARLDERLRELGVRDRADLRGYVPHDQLAELYARCHALLHISWTEGLPQVLFEAFAAALPVVATDVGGIAEATGEAVSLIPPGDARAAAGALDGIASDAAMRRRLVEAGHRLAVASTIDVEVGRTARFLGDGS